MSGAVQGWLTSCIGEVIEDIADGGTPNTNKTNYFNGDIPWVVIQDIHPRINTTRMNLTEQGLTSCSAKLWPVGTIILSTGATIGEVGIAATPLATKQGIVGIVCKQKILNRFLYYKLLGLKSYLRANAQGSTIKEIRPDFIRSISIEYPADINEQNCIAKILEQLDQAIEQTQAIIAKQQRIKTGLMQDLLTKGIDKNGNIRSESTHEFKDSPLGRIPVDWKPTTLGRVASLQRGYDIVEAEFVIGVFPVISSSGIIGYHNLSTVCGPNVVVGRKGSIGNVHFVETDFWAHDTSLFVTDFFGNSEKYIYYLLTYLNLGQYGTKSGSPSLNRNDIHPLAIGLPDTTEQKTIAEYLSVQDTLLRQFQIYHSKISRLKTGLMHDLLTGKVRVTDIQNPTLTPESI